MNTNDGERKHSKGKTDYNEDPSISKMKTELDEMNVLN